ncbi:MAG: tetratricopeptide repeat protein, partial [Anaerolineales bacterium]
MPEVSLRAYTKQIDELIERERLEEAIAHCRHILHGYPKHLETYRHLGKAYLEAKRYGDAADIFQRVLSAAPDDFVSHIGMAIVREDEGNLDAAIWHMERAFETNPANPAIQQEMKRLIGKRDGLEPHKVRLTRGALARMYAHGELYPQAVAELRSALQEDPERPDLQVLLADIYWQTNQQSEATTLSNRILEKLPYCLVANRILAAGLQAGDRVEEAAVFHRRIAGLDPYAAFVESAMVDPAAVEPSAVMLERLEWQAGEAQPGSRQPGWAATLGYEMKEKRRLSEAGEELPQTGPLPPWLEPGEPRPFEPRAEAELREEIGRQDELIEPTPETKEPAWMPELEASEPAESVEPAALEWDAKSAPEPGPAPSWMSEVEQQSEVSSAARTEPESAIPEWMQAAGWDESSGESTDRPVSFSDEELGVLDAGGLPAESAPAGDLAPAELPDWIHDMAPINGQEAEDAAEEPASPGLPSWIADEPAAERTDRAVRQPPAELEPDVETAGEAAFPKAESDGKDLPTWITEDSPGATETIVTWLGGRSSEPAGSVEEPAEDLPTWMRDTGPLEEARLDDETPPSGFSRRPASEPESGKPAAPPDLPGWLSAVAVAAAREEPPASPVIPPEEPAAPIQGPLATSEVPDWLSAAIESQEPPIEAERFPDEVSSETPEPTEAAPSWLSGLGETEAEDAPAEVSAEQAEAALPSGGSLDAAPGLETPDWLRGLAAEGADTVEVRGARGAGTPDWLREIAVPGSVSSEEADEPSAQLESAPDWLQGLAEEPEPIAPTAGVPDWLEGLDEGPAAPSEVRAEFSPPAAERPRIEAAPEPEPVEDDDAVLSWLEGLAARQSVAPTAESIPEARSAAPILEPRNIPEEAEEGLEWLEALAEQRGLDVDVSVPKPSARTPVPEPEPEAEPEPEPAQAEPTALDTAPDWLTRMSTQRLPKVEIPAEPPPEQPEPQVWSELDWAVEETAEAKPEPEPEPEDEVPGWLVEAAEKAEPSPSAPTRPAGSASVSAQPPAPAAAVPPEPTPQAVAPPVPPAPQAVPAPIVAAPAPPARRAKPDPAKVLEDSRQALATGDVGSAAKL